MHKTIILKLLFCLVSLNWFVAIASIVAIYKACKVPYIYKSSRISVNQTFICKTIPNIVIIIIMIATLIIINFKNHDYCFLSFSLDYVHAFIKVTNQQPHYKTFLTETIAQSGSLCNKVKLNCTNSSSGTISRKDNMLHKV